MSVRVDLAARNEFGKWKEGLLLIGWKSLLCNSGFWLSREWGSLAALGPWVKWFCSSAASQELADMWGASPCSRICPSSICGSRRRTHLAFRWSSDCKLDKKLPVFFGEGYGNGEKYRENAENTGSKIKPQPHGPHRAESSGKWSKYG